MQDEDAVKEEAKRVGRYETLSKASFSQPARDAYATTRPHARKTTSFAKAPAADDDDAAPEDYADGEDGLYNDEASTIWNESVKSGARTTGGEKFRRKAEFTSDIHDSTKAHAEVAYQNMHNL